MTRPLAALLLWSCIGLPAATAHAQIQADLLDRAIQHFNDLDDAEADSDLRAFLKRDHPPEQSARAHLYLGLVKLNALHLDDARNEFKSALRFVSTIELPYGVSPKAHVLFDQARQQFSQESSEIPVSRSTRPRLNGPASEQAPSRSTIATLPPRSKLSLVPAIVTAGAGVIALGAAIGFGIAEQGAQTQSQADKTAVQALADHQIAASDALVADVCFAAGGALAITGLVLFILSVTGGSGGTSDLDAHPTAGLVPTHGGLSMDFALPW